MKTWKQFLEARSATLNLTPAQQQQGVQAYQQAQQPAASTRRSARLNLTPAQQQQGAAAYQQAQPPAYGAPASDEEMGQQYAKSMQIQQARAAAQMGRRV